MENTISVLPETASFFIHTVSVLFLLLANMKIKMVSEPFRAYPSEYLCWAYRATRYRAAIGPPIIYSPTHELAVSA